MKHELVCYSCSQCYYKATTKGSLKKHVEPINESSTPVACDGCNFKGTTKGIFNKHVETIHEGVCYTCSQWDYKATTTPNLKRHVEAINELVCYSCKQCQCNGSNNKLLGNEQWRHWYKYPYSCS